jgi:hypothetical protein
MNNNEFMREIEINGIKVEVDLRTVRQITTYKIGDNVKLLMKSGGDYSVYPGVIVDFVNFKDFPALVVAYFKRDYFGTDIRFVTITKDTEDIDLAPCLPHELSLNKERVVDKFNVEIADAQRKVDELTQKRDYFIDNFAKFFDDKEAQ